MSDKVPATQGMSGSASFGFWAILGLGLGSAALIRMGYDVGIEQSRRILKRHDKDVRRMEKREKQYFKEQKKKEKEEQRRNKEPLWRSVFITSKD